MHTDFTRYVVVNPIYIATSAKTLLRQCHAYGPWFSPSHSRSACVFRSRFLGEFFIGSMRIHTFIFLSIYSSANQAGTLLCVQFLSVVLIWIYFLLCFKVVVLLSVSSLSDCFGLVAACPFVTVFCWLCVSKCQFIIIIFLNLGRYIPEEGKKIMKKIKVWSRH